MVQLVPGDAIVYVGWAGADQLGTKYGASHLKAVLDASDARKIFSEMLPALELKIQQKDPKAAEKLKIVTALAGPLWRHPSAFYFEGISGGAATPSHDMPNFAIFCQAGDEADALAGLVTELLKSAPAPYPITATAENGMFVLNGGVVTDLAHHLSDSAEFKSALDQVQKESALTVYVNADSLLKLIDAHVAKSARPETQQRWPQIREALGLSGVKQIICASGFAGKDWATSAFIAAPGPRVGLVSLLDQKPVSDDILKTVPKSATFVAASSFDVAKLFTEIRSVLASVDTNALAQYDKVMGMATVMLGTNVQTELIDALGDQWAVYFAPTVGGNGLLGMVAVNKLRDAQKVERSLEMLQVMINNMVAGQMRGPDRPTIAFRTIETDGMKIHYLAIPLLAPGWAVKDGNLYIAAFPQVIVTATRAATANESILQSEAFQSIRKTVEGEQATSLNFVNVPAIAGENYSMSLAMSRLVMGAADVLGVPAPAMIMPPLDKLVPELAPLAGAWHTDAAGFHYRGITPFPGAQVLATQSQVLLAQNAMLASILLPSLNRARETANRVKCASNERQIAMAMTMYANAHNGKFPNTMGELIKTQDIGLDAFVCPSANTPVPTNLKNPDEMADWIDAHSDYVYLGRGKTSSAPPDEIVLYEKPGDHGYDGINITYGDGHVEFQGATGAVKELQKANQPVPPELLRRAGVR